VSGLVIPKSVPGGAPTPPSQILDAARLGDEEAWSWIVLHFDPSLRRFVWVLLPRELQKHQEVEDVLQNTWEKVVRSFRCFRGDCEFSTWLFMVARSCCRDLGRYLDRRPCSPHEPDAIGRRLDSLGKHHGDVAEEFMKRDPTIQALSALPEAQRAAVFMVDWFGCSVREVAQAEGVTYDAFYRRLQHARRSLRSILELRPRAERRTYE
jgi:RNA polymerase sigma factor (sigma-70 family)